MLPASTAMGSAPGTLRNTEGEVTSGKNIHAPVDRGKWLSYLVRGLGRAELDTQGQDWEEGMWLHCPLSWSASPLSLSYPGNGHLPLLKGGHAWPTTPLALFHLVQDGQ